MHDDHVHVENRLRRALRERILPAVHPVSEPLEVTAWHVEGEPVPVADALGATYEPFPVGSRWGSPWATSWLRVRGTVPESFAGRRVEVLVDLGFDSGGPGFQAEGLAHTADGVPVKGISPRNAYVPVTPRATGGERIDLLVEAAANPTVLPWSADDTESAFVPTTYGDRPSGPADPLYVLRRVDVAVLDEEVMALALDLQVLEELMLSLPSSEPRRAEILRALERSLDALDLHDVAGTAAAAREQVRDVLSRPANASAHRISAVGHAHIDSAWLWPIRETKRKCARTFANVTALAADYPELVFACSSAQQYAWVKEQQPAIFARMQKAVVDGNWAPAGGMWVESDANMPGSEALARQFVQGQRFFREEFGVECEEVWLPDSFGYTAAFPQIARLAGARWFLTQKLSWNATNKLPNHTFWWEGLDGTRVFTHFPPVDTYNAEVVGAELAHAVSNFADKGGATRSLMPFGYGDGGGGPTREMLERARRFADLEGAARVQVQSPHDFFTAAEEEYADAPVWSGELYLELHRGTYTSQARTKRGNRRSEHLLRELELWATTAAVRAGVDYPHEALTKAWQTVLLHQFHDILPGSSIGWVHQEAAETYAALRTELESLIAAAVEPLTSGSAAVLNAAPFARAEAVASADGGVVWVEAPALGVGSVVEYSGTPVTVTSEDGATVLDNGVVRVSVDSRGLITSAVDLRTGREALAPGSAGNFLQLHPDHPNQWDAWDIDPHYRRVRSDLTDAVAVEVVGSGPLVGSVRVERRFGSSSVVQVISLAAGSARIDIDNEIDWHEQEKVLKAAFPLDVRAEVSSAEVQFGHVQRPTHNNTSWEAARFEICAHRWVHVGEPGYGHAVVNDSTYGHDVTRTTRPDGGTTTTVRLSLLRAPRFPDPRADQGQHSLRYGLVVGASVADAVEHGYALNLPLRVVGSGSAAAALPPLVEVEGDGVVVEAVKLAEDGSGDVVVRLYESLGGRGSAVVRRGFEAGEPAVVDLLERPLQDPALSPEVSAVEGGVRLALRPFQIATLRFARRG
ncbi:alpha-mannosidase [Motilibacter peucedani]|uniref:Alpha-mannosidase n=1 Tax=Motilibacter peucedani TaxID=598650 RepID=A0A420XUG4_9ACTN|nr:glycoside hydrolase family 38 C-terminal domain-containing protein [Motilibacter peucedani]RKS80468.1 alpha-mannosidase [Motilibacter peucedani]